MENSFFEYRDQSGVEVESDSDTDIIEESFLEELMPKTPMKTPMRNNLTVVPDSDESLVYDGSDNETDNPQAPKTIIGSSDDEEVSPELLPKRRPPIRPKSLNTTTDSPVIRRVKKRMVLDSDSDNSIIIEKAVKSKVRCQKETPLKIDGGKDGKVNDSDESCDETMDDGDDTFKIDQGKGDDEESDYDAGNEEEIDNGNDTNDSEVESDSSHNDKAMDEQGKDDKDDTSAESDDDAEVGEKTADDHDEEGYDEGPNEDLMVMSRATRMSIMGIIPKQNESDESDFIESDESVKPSIRGSTESLTDLPADVATNRTPLAESTRRVTEMNLSPPEDGGSLEDSDSDLPEVNTTRTPHKPKTPKPSTPHEGFEDSDSDLPEVNITTRTPHKPKTPKPLTPVKALDDSNDDSVLTCSPIQSPLRDVTADFNNSPKSAKKTLKDKVLNNLLANDNKTYYDGEVTVVDDGFAKPKSKITKNTYYDGEVTVVEETGKAGKENVREDEDVTVIESVPEVIMLSSDEEDEVSTVRINSGEQGV